MQRAARRFPEVCGQQDQGDDDEQREHCAPPSNLLVMHEIDVSKFLLRTALLISLRLIAAAPVA
jgi:hypothetical protein